MAHIEVVFAGSGVWPARKAASDANGRFHIKGVPEGIYELRASSRSGLVADPIEGLLLKDSESRKVELVLGPGQTLIAVVHDAHTHAPIPQAQVVVSEDSLGFTPKATRTDAQGKFTVSGLRAMMHRVSVRAQGYVPVIGAQHQPNGSSIQLLLERGATLSGKLIDDTGAPVKGALLEVMGSETDETPVLLSANTEVFRDALFNAQMNGPTPVYPAGELGVTYGKVPRIPQTPVAIAHTSNEATPSDARFMSDAQGMFKLEGVPPGKLQLLARHTQYALAFSDPLLVRAGSTLSNITLMLSKGGSIVGHVVDAKGAPVPHVRVQLKVEREPWPRHALTDAQGRFEVTALLGAVELDAYAGADSLARASVHVESGMQHDVVLRLSHTAFTIAGRVVEQGRFGVSGARITVRHAETQRTTVSASDGRFELAGLPEPPYHLRVEHSDFAVYQASVGAEHTLLIDLKPGGQMHGQVFDRQSGAGIANATVQAQPMSGGTPQQTRTHTDGQFEFPRLSVGHYTITISATGYLSTRLNAELLARRSSVSDLDLRTIELDPAGSISGEVVDRYGQPVAVAQVTYGEPPQWDKSTLTNEKGIFRLGEVPPGRYRLSARHSEGGETMSRREIRVFAGQDSPTAYLRLEALVP